MRTSERPVLLLDVMDTLVHDPFFREVPEFFQMSLEELLAAKHPTAWREFECAEIDEATLVAKFFADGRSFDVSGLKRTLTEGYRWIDGVEELVADLCDAGIEMHALSNYAEWYALIEARLSLSRYVAWTFVSCTTGVRKPDPRAYLGAAEAVGRPVGECIFVDDREKNCAGARNVGMPAIRFKDATTLRATLRTHGVLA